MLPVPVDLQSFSDSEVSAFRQDGFLIVRNLIPETYVRVMSGITDRDLRLHQGDVEYEAELNYPGAPTSLESEGGRTIRRLRQAVSRDPVFAELLKEPFILQRLQQLLGPHVVMPMAHHNCIMTKQPKFSSDTGWHQDTRYWSFQTPELINLWIALGEENPRNGCLQVLPGSHVLPMEQVRLDADLFLDAAQPDNQPLLKTARSVELQAGDVLFFHARCFHAATRNYTQETKRSVVFTFRSLDNPPNAGTRSAALPELLLS